MSESALAGVKILEYCRTATGAYTTKMMADLGAEVIKVETPGIGDPARSKPPFAGDVSHQEKSALFLFLNSNKLSITLDAKNPVGKQIFKRLARDADILVEDGRPGDMEEAGIGYEVLREFNGGLVMASITPYGRTGPYRDYKAYQLNLAASSGQAFLLPQPAPDMNRPPVKPGGNMTDYDPALMAVVAILAAHYWKLLSGRGQFIEISKQEAIINMQRVDSLTYPNAGFFLNRSGTANPMPGGGLMKVKDGYVVVVAPEDHQWEGLVRLMGDPAWAKEDWCKDRYLRFEHAPELKTRIQAWIAAFSKQEIYELGQAANVPIAPVHDAADIAASVQLRENGFWTEMNHPVVGRFPYPSSAYRFSRTPWSLRRSAPLLGEHTEEILCSRLGFERDELLKLRHAGVV